MQRPALALNPLPTPLTPLAADMPSTLWGLGPAGPPQPQVLGGAVGRGSTGTMSGYGQYGGVVVGAGGVLTHLLPLPSTRGTPLFWELIVLLLAAGYLYCEAMSCP